MKVQKKLGLDSDSVDMVTNRQKMKMATQRETKNVEAHLKDYICIVWWLAQANRATWKSTYLKPLMGLHQM